MFPPSNTEVSEVKARISQFDSSAPLCARPVIVCVCVGACVCVRVEVATGNKKHCTAATHAAAPCLMSHLNSDVTGSNVVSPFMVKKKVTAPVR